MKVLWITLSALAAAYIILIIGPALTSFFNIYGRKRGIPLWERKELKNSYYEPYVPKIKADTERLNARPYSTVTVKADDGVELIAKYFCVNKEKLAILVHGYNTMPENNFSEIANDLLDCGISVLMPYSRAHIPSGGKHSSLGIIEQYDLLKWIDYAIDSLGAGKTVIYGMSMGCTVTAYASDKIKSENVRAMVLDCGFDSPLRQYSDNCKSRKMPSALLTPLIHLLGKIVLKQDLSVPVSTSLEKTAIPALFIHGTADTTVKQEYTEKNYNACASQKKLIIADNAPHTFSYTELKKKNDCSILEFIKSSIE